MFIIRIYVYKIGCVHFLPKGNVSSKRQFSLLSIKHVMPFIIMVKILLFIEVSLTQREQALNTPWSRGLHHSLEYLWSPTILLYIWSPTMPCPSTVIKTDIASSQIFCRGAAKHRANAKSLLVQQSGRGKSNPDY